MYGVGIGAADRAQSASVGTPDAAVGLPSLPPPTATPSMPGLTRAAIGNNVADEASGIGGRLMPPRIRR